MESKFENSVNEKCQELPWLFSYIVECIMERYLRFGEIPPGNRSINFLKMKLSECKDFSWRLENYGADETFGKYVPENVLEEGISVFRMSDDGMPILDNMQITMSLASRIEKPIYELTGEEVGIGNDGEPLISNITEIERVYINQDVLANYIISVLARNFMKVTPPQEDDERNIDCIFEFYHEYQVNIKTGEMSKYFGILNGDGWIKIPGHLNFSYNGWTFEFPVPDFSIETGYRKR